MIKGKEGFGGKALRNGCLLLGLLFLLSGCSQKPPEPPEPPVVEEKPPVEETKEKVYPFRYPLTGLGSEREAKERPIMVMVENQAKARPQSGLDQADIVYEILAEGEITRFVAVYHSQSPEIIGPVRSIRPYFVEIGDGLDAIIVHAGWSPEAMNMIAQRRLDHLDQVYGDDAYYWRDSSRKAPHNLYTSIEKIRQGAEEKKFRQEWNGPRIKFADPEQTPEGVSASKVGIEYLLGYHVSYEYDAQTKTYLRFMDGKPHKDRETEDQISASNVLVIEAEHRIVDQAGRRAVNIFGPGKGFLIQQGKAVEIEWKNVDGFIRLYHGGEEIGLIPGKTWIQVVPIGSKVTIE